MTERFSADGALGNPILVGMYALGSSLYWGLSVQLDNGGRNLISTICMVFHFNRMMASLVLVENPESTGFARKPLLPSIATREPHAQATPKGQEINPIRKLLCNLFQPSADGKFPSIACLKSLSAACGSERQEARPPR